MAETARTTAPTAQRVWRVIQWIGFACSVFLMLEALFALPLGGGLAWRGVALTILGAVAALIAAIFVTRIVRRGVSTIAFVKGTTTARVIAVAWVLIQLAIAFGTVVGVIGDFEATELDWTAGIVGTVGSVSLIAMLGPGYSEYRAAMEAGAKS
jgi:hypothetical protein